MFERYTELARRALFFARYAVSEHGGAVIEPVHLLLGVLRADAHAVLRFARSGETLESIAARVVANLPGAVTLSTSADIPFSTSTKTALEHARVEADDRGDASIRPEHLLLGVLVKTSGAHVDALRECGVDVHTVRQHLDSARA